MTYNTEEAQEHTYTHIYLLPIDCTHYWAKLSLLYKLTTIFWLKFWRSWMCRCVREDERLLGIECLLYILTTCTRRIVKLSTAFHPAKHKRYYQVFVLRSSNVIRLIVWEKKELNNFCFMFMLKYTRSHLDAQKRSSSPRISCSFHRFSEESVQYCV